MAWLVVKEFFIGGLTWGLTLSESDPKRFCDVLVVRRDTRAVVLAYPYSHVSGQPFMSSAFESCSRRQTCSTSAANLAWRSMPWDRE
jgi:hypothetical protein